MADALKVARIEAGSGILSPLRHAVFLRIWTASLLSNLGLLIMSVGAAWSMTQMTASADKVALVQTALMLPVALISALAGAIADMFDRRIVGLVALTIALAGAVSLTGLAWVRRRNAGPPALVLLPHRQRDGALWARLAGIRSVNRFRPAPCPRPSRSTASATTSRAASFRNERPVLSSPDGFAGSRRARADPAAFRWSAPPQRAAPRYPRPSPSAQSDRLILAPCRHDQSRRRSRACAGR